eukprot:m.46055 g.46055  ORF g.46055 m.46055 type:complete len:168 (+) comp33664_c0_seq5:717-1220(+)
MLTRGSLNFLQYQAYAMLVRSGLMVFRSTKRSPEMDGNPEPTAISCDVGDALAARKREACRDAGSDTDRKRPRREEEDSEVGCRRDAPPTQLSTLAVHVLSASIALDVLQASVLALSALLPGRKPLVCPADAISTGQNNHRGSNFPLTFINFGLSLKRRIVEDQTIM